MIYLKNVKKFCKDDISLIENYDKAIADDTQTWHCHHRRETIFSRKDLIDIGEYYNRPACELIFLTPLEHIRLHHLGKHLSAETRKKMSKARINKPKSAETRKKMSEAQKGKHRSEETRKKIGEAQKGKSKPKSAETRKKISESKKGKPKSAEARKKMSESKNGSYFFNNGVKSIRAKECPGPEWQRGRRKRKALQFVRLLSFHSVATQIRLI